MAFDRLPIISGWEAARRHLAANLPTIGWSPLGVTCVFLLSIGHCIAASQQEWNGCKSQDLDTNVSACTSIIDDTATSDADRLEALGLRGAAFLARRSYVSAGKDFASVIRLDPGNVVALAGRAVVGFRRGDRDQAVMDFSIAKALDPGKLATMVAASDDLKEVANSAAQSPPSRSQLDAALDHLSDARLFMLKVCNKHSRNASVAVMGRTALENNDWHVQGWWSVSPGQCNNIRKYVRGVIYLFAQEDGNAAFAWEGTSSKVCVAFPGPFDRVNRDGYVCRAPEKIVGFSSFVVSDRIFTWNLNP